MGKSNKKSRKTPAEPPDIIQADEESELQNMSGNCGVSTRATTTMQRQMDETRNEMKAIQDQMGTNMKLIQDQMGCNMKLIQDQMGSSMKVLQDQMAMMMATFTSQQ